jgi:hypothetical protein
MTRAPAQCGAQFSRRCIAQRALPHAAPHAWRRRKESVIKDASQPREKMREGGSMYAIVYKSDGFPICRQIAGVSPDPVVTWNTEDAAKAFISAKGGEGDFLPVALTDEAMDKIAVSMGCPVESITFDPYPG